MANVLVEETSLSNIASAIRGKNGSTAVYKPGEMAAAITNLPTGGGDTETINFSTDISYLFASDGGCALYEAVKNKNLVFTNICYGRGVFYGMRTNDTITPFTIHLLRGIYNEPGNVDFRNFYEGSSVVSNIVIDPPIGRASNTEFQNFFTKSRLKNIDLSCIDTNDPIFGETSAKGLFSESGYLRSINFTNSPQRYFGGSNNIQYDGTFYHCFDLDSIEGLYTTIQATFLGGTFNNCSHLAKLTFKTASPTNAKNPYYSSDIDLSTVGYYTNVSEGYIGNAALHYGNDPLLTKSLVRENATKEITNATTYAKLKNDPDAWTTNVAYSRYNKTSAKETLTSLPYIKETCTIKFKGEAGSATDGGAIKNLTSSEIAAAAAKKWTVAFA